jgi:hypothetical protein
MLQNIIQEVKQDNFSLSTTAHLPPLAFSPQKSRHPLNAYDIAQPASLVINPPPAHEKRIALRIFIDFIQNMVKIRSNKT